MATDAGTPEGERPAGIDRRELIQRAAAAGVVAWTAPLVVDSLFSPALATHGTPTAGCFKYMFNWCWANDVQVCQESGALSGFDQNGPPAPECAQSLGENAAGQIQTNPNCCQQNGPDGNNLQWHQVPDFPATCVTRTGADCICPGGTNGAISVTFRVTCTDCYFADVTVLHGMRTGLEDTPPPAGTNCGAFSLSTSNTGGSPFTRSWTINFPGGSSGRRPIWFKFWVGCGLSICSPQTVPCTQSACLPGPPPGQPVDNRELNI